MKDTDGPNFVTDDNTGGYFVMDCEECGHIFNSGGAPGGGPIADTGDYGDCYCPNCEAADPAEADNPGRVWNAQQARINQLIEAARQRTTDELRAEFEKTISSLQGVRYSLARDENGEYRQGAVFHMWTGYRLSAADNGLVERNEYGVIDNY